MVGYQAGSRHKGGFAWRVAIRAEATKSALSCIERMAWVFAKSVTEKSAKCMSRAFGIGEALDEC